jgi:hypothetical protein
MGHTSDETGINIESSILWYQGQSSLRRFPVDDVAGIRQSRAEAITRIRVRRSCPTLFCESSAILLMLLNYSSIEIICP